MIDMTMAAADPVAVAVRFGLYAVLGILFGLPLFTVYSGGDRSAIPSLRPLVGISAGLGLALSLLGLGILAAGMAGVPIAEVDAETLQMVVTLPGTGSAWIVRAAALALLVVAALAIANGRMLSVAAIGLGGAALGSLAFSGHAMMTEGTAGDIHLVADILHLLAGGAWLGALLAFALLLSRSSRTQRQSDIVASYRALGDFAVVGTVIVGTLVVTGLVNVWTVIGIANIGQLFTSFYGWLFLGKIALFVVMLGLAAANRYRLTPALVAADAESTRTAITALRRSIAIEATTLLALLALVAWLGLLAPPTSI